MPFQRARRAGLRRTEFAITVYAPDPEQNPNVFAPLLDEIFEEIDRLEDLLTTWRPDSQIMHVNRNAYAGPVRVSADVFTLLLAALMGVAIPYLRVRFGRDPAVGSSVLITACTDSGGFFIFLGLATLFLL